MFVHAKVSWLAFSVLIGVVTLIVMAITMAAGKRSDERGRGLNGPTTAGVVLLVLGALVFLGLLTARAGVPVAGAFSMVGRKVTILPVIGGVAVVWFIRNRGAGASLEPRQRAYFQRGIGLLVAALAIPVVGVFLGLQNRFILLWLPGGLFVLGLATIFRARSGTQDQPDTTTPFTAPAPAPRETQEAPPPPAANASAEAPGEDVIVTKMIGAISIRLADAQVRDGRISTGMGNVQADLRSVSVPPGEHHLTLSAGIGNIEITLPHRAAYRVDLRSGIGAVRMGDRHNNGIDSSLTWESPDFADADHRLLIHANTLVGNIACS